MKNSTGKLRILACGARAIIVLRIAIVLLAAANLAAMAEAATSSSAGRGNPRLASLQIEIWPEYDRPASALVILRGEIAADVSLPAAVSLRIAAATGGPTAVAYSAEPGGAVLNLKYERRDASDFITLEFDSPKRFFHIEFYEPLSTSAPARNYTYAWAGDLATDRLNVVLQEPAAASDLQVRPGLDATAVGQDGLRYRSAELGPFPAGKPLTVTVNYTKADPRTSSEIRTPQAPAVATPPTEGQSKVKLAIGLVVVVTLLALGAIAASFWWYRRKGLANLQSSETGHCGKCGAPSSSGDAFCSKCGAPLARPKH